MQTEAECVEVEPELRGEAFDREKPVDHRQAEALQGECKELIEKLGSKLRALREVSNFDYGRGQCIGVVVSAPRKTDPATGKKTLKSRCAPKAGSTIRVPVTNVGINREEVEVEMVVPPEGMTNECSTPNQKKAGAILKPQFYPHHDKYMARVLRDLAKVLTGEEMSAMKAPHFQVTHNGAVIGRDPLDLEALAQGEHFPRNPRRLGNYHSGVGEILAMCERIADPSFSASATLSSARRRGRRTRTR